MPEEFIHHGALPGRNPLGTDFVAGTLPYEIVVPDGNHLTWIPTDEPQSGAPYTLTERYNCVTQAHHNAVENIMMRDIQLGRMPPSHKKWLQANGYFDDNGKINFSENFNSIRNGTNWNDPDPNKRGNYVWKVCEDARKTSGLIPQRMLPDNPNMPNVEYYNPARITQPMIDLGQESMKRFVLPYEWIGNTQDEITVHLKQAPLMVTRPGHEIVGVKHKTSTYLTINDSYNPFVKDLAYSKVTDVMKVLVQYLGVPMFPTKKVKVNGSYGVAIITPNMVSITLAEDEAEWRSYSKPDSYQVHSVNADGSTDWTVDTEINFPQ